MRRKTFNISKRRKEALKKKLQPSRSGSSRGKSSAGSKYSSEKSGRIVKGKKGSKNDISIRKADKYEGHFQAHPRGFGFVTVEGFDEDFFIPEECVGSAMNGDTVRIALLPKTEGKRREGLVVAVLERAVTTVVGRFEKTGKYGFVIPDDQKLKRDIFIPSGYSLGAADGQKVVCEILDYGNDKKKPEGEIVEILGDKDTPGIDVISIVRAMNIPSEFSLEALHEADKVCTPVKKKDIKGRVDLRDIPMVTIDGAESKDLDDAVSIGVDGDDYYLGVHIADVSEYVKENGFLDTDAKDRGTSVYLCDRVIPMLPKNLSNGICSLNQGEDRLALSCLMKINAAGKVEDYVVCESVVNIDRRMTYDAVTKIVEDSDPELSKEYADFADIFKVMAKLSSVIRKRRNKKGCIDFDFTEAKILLDKDGKVSSIVPRERDIASLMIEDFMITANVTVAKEFCKLGIPFLYRTHGKPDSEKLDTLASFTAKSGLTFRNTGDKIEPKDIQRLIKAAKGKAEEPVINQFVLRSMQQAKYTVTEDGHFGLAEKYYCHFTSPIRRYPDLQIHRIIKECLRGKLNKKRISHYESILPKVASFTSSFERRAEEAERETDKMKKAEYMSFHRGEIFDGVISGVTAFGIYVTLPNTIEGLVHITELKDDYYSYVEDSMELIGERKKRVYKIGQSVRIKVLNADKETRLIDFALAEKYDATEE